MSQQLASSRSHNIAGTKNVQYHRDILPGPSPPVSSPPSLYPQQLIRTEPYTTCANSVDFRRDATRLGRVPHGAEKFPWHPKEHRLGPCEGYFHRGRAKAPCLLICVVTDKWGLLNDWNGVGCHANYSSKQMREPGSTQAQARLSRSWRSVTNGIASVDSYSQTCLREGPRILGGLPSRLECRATDIVVEITLLDK